MAALTWYRLLSRQRLGAPASRPAPSSQDTAEHRLRSVFQQDYDRLVFSPAFRRLGRKTQVHNTARIDMANTRGDHIHTRLTHSIEVSCVGRSLGLKAGDALARQGLLPPGFTPDDLGAIVQAACLAHDIGNPPFGHAGEQAIRHHFAHDLALAAAATACGAAQARDLATFEGNAQGFRIVTQLENHRDQGGLRLTCATLGTTLKYPWLSTHPLAQSGKFSCYLSEQELLATLARELGLPQLGEGRWQRHPLSYLMEAADDICYAILDLEDGVELGEVDFYTVRELLSGLAHASREHRKEGTGAAQQMAPARVLSRLRAKAIEHCVEEIGRSFLEHHNALLRGELEAGNSRAGDAEKYDLVTLSAVGADLKQAKHYAFDHVYPEEIDAEARACLGSLLTLARQAVAQQTPAASVVPAVLPLSGTQTDMRWACGTEAAASSSPASPAQRDALARWCVLLGEDAPQAAQSTYDNYRRTLDFIGGLTDQHALALAASLAPHPC